jgi:hypothetical protein
MAMDASPVKPLAGAEPLQRMDSRVGSSVRSAWWRMSPGRPGWCGRAWTSATTGNLMAWTDCRLLGNFHGRHTA